MPHYYDLKKEEVIKTKTEIPEEMWEKKGLLPLKYVVHSHPEGEEITQPDGIYVLDEWVESVRNKFFHVNTLDEEKVLKVKSLKYYVNSKLPSYEERVDYLCDLYDADKTSTIKADLKDWNDYFLLHEEAIMGLSDVESVKSYEYRTQEDIDKANAEDPLAPPEE